MPGSKDKTTKPKYNTTGFAKSSFFNRLQVDPRFTKGLTEATNLAISQNTKGQYQTAYNHVNRCAVFTGQDMDFPFDLTKTLNYVGFLMEVRKVSSNTISQYISAIRFLHLVQGQDPSSLRPGIITLVLRGREHWEQVGKMLSKKVQRLAVTVPWMKYIKKVLVHMKLAEEVKLMIWAVCCLMFCGSLRVHEILSKEDLPCPHTTLMYEDFEFSELMVNKIKKNVIKIRIKSPKENRVGSGIWLEIFENGTFMCPVRSLKKWLVKAKPKPGQTLFCFPNNTPFKGKDLNKILSEITGPLTEGSGGMIRSHSFRASMPTEMGLRQEILSNTSIE